MMKRLSVMLAAVLMWSLSPLAAEAHANAAIIVARGSFVGTASVDCAGRGCNVVGYSTTCAVAGTLAGTCSVSFYLQLDGLECSAGTGGGAAAFSFPGAGATVPLKAANTGRAITANGSQANVGGNKVLEITISLPLHLCTGNYPFTGTAQYLHAAP